MVGTNQIQNNQQGIAENHLEGDAAPDFVHRSAAQVKGFLASNNSWNRCVVTLYNLERSKEKNKEDIAKLYFHRAIACVDLSRRYGRAFGDLRSKQIDT